jgi:DNA-binding transcriptional LysR family regulator
VDGLLRDKTRKPGKPTIATEKLRVRLSGFDAICRMVERGIGFGVIPEAAARRCGKSMAIRAVPLTDAWVPRHLTICARRLDELSAHARQLIEHLKASGDEVSRAQ